MGIKIFKDFRNKANRITNCETANISKTVQAAVMQIDAINKIEKAYGLVPCRTSSVESPFSGGTTLRCPCGNWVRK